MPTLDIVCEVIREVFYIAAIAVGISLFGAFAWVVGILVNGYSVMPV